MPRAKGQLKLPCSYHVALWLDASIPPFGPKAVDFVDPSLPKVRTFEPCVLVEASLVIEFPETHVSPTARRALSCLHVHARYAAMCWLHPRSADTCDLSIPASSIMILFVTFRARVHQRDVDRFESKLMALILRLQASLPS